ncbi:hypothetical protein ACFL35_18605 [Candidatus Riflebacteria bacterium]
MHPTALLYSSHNRCEYLHRWWIVERALQDPFNKLVVYLPMSEAGSSGEFGTPQQFGWSKFEWYLNFFRKWGLEAYPFYWNDNLTYEDARAFFEMCASCQVLILGGGNSVTGLERYKGIGEWFFGDRGLFERVLHGRAEEGKLTVGFSAGCDQLGAILHSQTYTDLPDPHGFGLAHNVMTSLHHEDHRNEELWYTASQFPHCMVFGLPNDSGLAVSQGFLPSGNIWQLIEFVTDNSWDLPQDGFHIKTRQGQGIEHVYNDGKHWKFNGGDRMARVMSPDGVWQEAYIFNSQGYCFHYWSQHPATFPSIDAVFASY